jgi:hypothetical protein
MCAVSNGPAVLAQRAQTPRERTRRENNMSAFPALPLRLLTVTPVPLSLCSTFTLPARLDGLA